MEGLFRHILVTSCLLLSMDINENWVEKAYLTFNTEVSCWTGYYHRDGFSKGVMIGRGI